jgi:hypothetical protein
MVMHPSRAKNGLSENSAASDDMLRMRRRPSAASLNTGVPARTAARTSAGYLAA